jgi:hypothetical protein
MAAVTRWSEEETVTPIIGMLGLPGPEKGQDMLSLAEFVACGGFAASVSLETESRRNDRAFLRRKVAG